jgi:DNA helicase-2/ATP-dependent DNA helicase PcrA
MLQFQGKFKKKSFKKIVPKAPEKILPWSDHQKVIFNNIENGDGHTVIQSSPGSGKSTTILQGLRHVPDQYKTDNKTLFTAFTSSSAKHLESHIPKGVYSKTHHSLGFAPLRKAWGHVYGIGGMGSVDIKNDSAFALATEEVGHKANENKLRQMLVFAMDYAKISLADTVEDIEKVIDQFGIDLCGIDSVRFSNHVLSMMNKCAQAPRKLNGRSVISYADMIYLWWKNGWDLQKFDRVFVDEAQDLSPARTTLIINSLALGGRICAVLDKNQAIFGFAGASDNVVDMFMNELKAKQLHLSVSYRCPRSVIELAKRINPLIEAAPNAIDGTIDSIKSEDLYASVKEGSVILSRTNWPLIRACYKMLAMNMKVCIKGKDIGDRFQWRINCWANDTVESLINSINGWREEMCDRLIRRKQSTETVEDEARSLELFTEGASTIEEVKDRINSFFSDSPAQITLSTVHKYKGLENPNVYLLSKTLHPDRGGEEERIYYTGITRSSNCLTFVEGKI